MSEYPIPKSWETILGGMLATYRSKTGINDLNVGAANLSFFESVAQAIYRASGDTFSILRDLSVERAKGEALQRLATDENIPPLPAKVSTGYVTISDTSFNKISTKIYAGTNPPNIGSTDIKVSDASFFTSSGFIYIGRGTPNIEGPIAYSSITVIGSYYKINLDAPTTKYHNLSESVILAQGGTRTISAGEVVRTPFYGGSESVSFTTTLAATILDGEQEVSSVLVAAEEPGAEGNVPRGSIREFVTDPFIGAAVTNPNPFITGRPNESNDELKNRIKKARISRGLGTATAVKSSVINAQASDENSVVTSSEIFSSGDETILYIDNGEGYEEGSIGVGQEFIIDSALGGETHFQLATGGSQTSIAKTFLETTNASPYNVNPNDKLSILVGDILNEHIFADGDFQTNGFATAYEIAASINANSNVDFIARTANNGTEVVVYATEETNEYLQITSPAIGVDSNLYLGFPSNEVQTLRLYKNKQPLSRNGRSAQVSSANQNDWSNTIATGDTLIISVDGTAEITYTFTDADFITEGTHSSVSKSNTIQSWINVINTKITGVTASLNGTQFVLISNLGTNTRASLNINVTSTLVVKGMFTDTLGLEAEGCEADFILSRNTGQIKLINSLESGDNLVAGSEFTNGAIQSSVILGGSVTLAVDGYLWFLIDNLDAEIINHGVIADSVIHFSKEGSNTVRFKSELINAFVNVQEGDYVIIWTKELLAVNRIEGRVSAVGTDANPNDYFEIRITAAEYAATIAEATITFTEGLSFVRSENPPQKIKVAAGVHDINALAIQLTSDLHGATTTIENDEIITVTTDSKALTGSVLVVSFDDAAKILNFTIGNQGISAISHFAFYENQNLDSRFPLFLHSSITGDKLADPPNTVLANFTSAVALGAAGVDPNMMVNMLHPYLFSGAYVKDSQPLKENTQIKSLVGATVNLVETQFMRRLRVNDRFFVSSPYDFSYNDSIIAVLDSNPSEKTFPIPLYRRAIPNNTMPINANSFRAYDVESGVTETFDTFFGINYDFSNYKAYMRAHNAIDPSYGGLTNEDAIMYHSALWGHGGERYNVGYIYPSGANNDIGHTIGIDSAINIRISLKSGAIVPNIIDGTTEWNVTITPNTPVAGMEEVAYTWNIVGTNPTMTTLAIGDYVTILSSSGFNSANLGTFRISFATATSFTVRRPSGSGVAENNIPTLQVGAINIYEDSATSAADIVAYVTSNLTDYISVTLLDDNGTTGAGIIVLSTYEDSKFVVGTESVILVDGINWIASSDVDAVAPLPNFTFKNALTLPSFDTATVAAYAFRNGEEVRFLPTTAKHLDEFFSTLAVSGITTLGEVENSQRRHKLQLSTQTFGSTGAIQISGGTGNTAVASILGTSSLVDNGVYLRSSINRSSAAGLHVDQWVKLNTSIIQKNDSGISFLTNVTIAPNLPTIGQSVIIMGNRENHDRYFGQPRNHIRDRARAFHVEKHGFLVCISWDGATGATPAFSKNVEINDTGGNISVDYDPNTGLTEYTIATGTRSFAEVSPGDFITFANFADAENNGTFEVFGTSDNKLIISTNNPDGVDAVAAVVNIGDVSVTTEVAEGDTIEIREPFHSINQGLFRVIRRYVNSIYIENSAAVEERVVVVANLRTLGFDGTTQFDVTVPGDMRISWDNTGTEPTLANAKMGDIITIGTDFAAVNRGDFMITNSKIGLCETTLITCISSADITTGEYFTIDLPNVGTQYYVWYNKDGGGGDPAPGGKIAIPVAITTGDSDEVVAGLTQAAIDLVAGFTATVLTNIVTVINDDYGDSVDAANVDVGVGLGTDLLDVTVSQDGRLNYIECANALAVAENNVTIADVLECHEPGIIFHDYDNSIVGDSFVISGDILGIDNVGSYIITEVLNKNELVIDSILVAQYQIALASKANQVYVEEAMAYTGYKKIYNMVVDSTNINRYIILFDTINQVSKINYAASVSLSALNKLNFLETIVQGLDSYRYNTGLIAESNKIVYGDPRDVTTYPGVSAAGAEIFILVPRSRRVKVAIAIRVQTGIPFRKVIEQVRNNIASLINGSPIGQSIAISDIISTVNTIPGVKAVSISSPLYSPTNDVIVINPGEQPIILDVVNDIMVSKVGD